MIIISCSTSAVEQVRQCMHSVSNTGELVRLLYKKKLRGLVRQRTIPTERPPLVGEVSANFSG
jgi:hypothetical protein